MRELEFFGAVVVVVVVFFFFFFAETNQIAQDRKGETRKYSVEAVTVGYQFTRSDLSLGSIKGKVGRCYRAHTYTKEKKPWSTEQNKQAKPTHVIITPEK